MSISEDQGLGETTHPASEAFARALARGESPEISDFLSEDSPASLLGELVSIGTLLAFTIVCLSILVLRKTRPGIDRPFRCPGLPWVPLAGAFVCLAQMFALPFDTWLRLVVWLALGLAIYFFYGIRHSRLNPVSIRH